MAVSKSSLSAGEIIHAALSNNEDVMKRAKKIYPVVEDSAELPYIVYWRSQFAKGMVKNERGNDAVTIEVQCYTGDYVEGVELAEAVRDALDGSQITHEYLTMRACDLVDSEETWISDAYVQCLTFNCKM